MHEKTSATRLSANSFYADLAKRSGQSPRWNFHEYVVDRNGTLLTSFGTRIEPDQKEFVELVERLLAAKPAPSAS